MVTTSEEYRTDNVTVNVEWTLNVPEVPIEFTGCTRVELALLYNTEYNISVKATLLFQTKLLSHVQLFYGMQYVANCDAILYVTCTHQS